MDLRAVYENEMKELSVELADSYGSIGYVSDIYREKDGDENNVYIETDLCLGQ